MGQKNSCRPAAVLFVHDSSADFRVMMRWPSRSVHIVIVAPKISSRPTKEKPATLHQPYLSNIAFAIFLWCWHAWWCLCLPPCEGSLFTYDLACSNWWNGAVLTFILLEWCAFILDVTAEYEYENIKRAVESDWVLIFMRITHNVFTGLVVTCYFNGLYSAGCVWAADYSNTHICVALFHEENTHSSPGQRCYCVHAWESL